MFVPLRLHSVYSRGKGSVTLDEAAEWAGRRRLPAAALADVGNIYGWGKWKRVAAGGGVRPLFGCELECGGLRFVFLVKTREGYSNLMEIFNRREVRDASGLVVIYVPEGQSLQSQGGCPPSGTVPPGTCPRRVTWRARPRCSTTSGRKSRREISMSGQSSGTFEEFWNRGI